jgi:uncharacterized protein (DUF433 family)
MAAVQFSQIEKIADQPARLTRLPRIRVAQLVMDYLAHGWSPEELCRHQPHVTPAEAHTAMAYYYDHQNEIDAEIRTEVSDNRAARATAPLTPFESRMQAAGIL